MADFQFCRVPIIATCVFAVGSNVPMLWSILKKRGPTRSTYFVFATIGFSNLFFCLLLVIRALSEDSTRQRPVLEATLISAVLVVLLFQIFSNYALAYDRYIAVSQPLAYRLSSRLSHLKKCYVAAFVIITIFSTTVSFLCILKYENKMYLARVMTGSKLAFCIPFLVIYYKIYQSFKTGSRCRSNRTENSRQFQTEDVQLSRRKQEKHLVMNCLGVTITFLLLNLPLIILDALTSFGDDCSTAQGKALASSITLVNINITLDPCWYFNMERRRSQIR